MVSPKKLANGNPLCWHCLKRLVYKRGGGFTYREVVDGGGTVHRVHHDCERRVLGDGVRPIASRPGPSP